MHCSSDVSIMTCFAYKMKNPSGDNVGCVLDRRQLKRFTWDQERTSDGLKFVYTREKSRYCEFRQENSMDVLKQKRRGCLTHTHTFSEVRMRAML